jgi:hypothetical protein
MGRLSNKFYDIPSHTTTSGTDLSEYWPGEGGFHNPGFKELRVVTNRTAETGTCTLDVILQFRMPAANLWQDCVGQDGAVIDGIQYANSTVETTATHMLRVGPGIIDVDADGYLVVNTVDAWFNYVLPQFFRVKYKSGGTTVTNTFSSTIFLLNG